MSKFCDDVMQYMLCLLVGTVFPWHINYLEQMLDNISIIKEMKRHGKSDCSAVQHKNSSITLITSTTQFLTFFQNVVMGTNMMLHHQKHDQDRLMALIPLLS